MAGRQAAHNRIQIGRHRGHRGLEVRCDGGRMTVGPRRKPGRLCKRGGGLLGPPLAGGPLTRRRGLLRQRAVACGRRGTIRTPHAGHPPLSSPAPAPSLSRALSRAAAALARRAVLVRAPRTQVGWTGGLPAAAACEPPRVFWPAIITLAVAMAGRGAAPVVRCICTLHPVRPMQTPLSAWSVIDQARCLKQEVTPAPALAQPCALVQQADLSPGGSSLAVANLDANANANARCPRPRPHPYSSSRTPQRHHLPAFAPTTMTRPSLR